MGQIQTICVERLAKNDSIVEIDGQNQPLATRFIRTEQIEQLRSSSNIVDIKWYVKLDRYKKQIEQYQKDSKQYRISVSFYHCCSLDNITKKIELLKMINIVNSDNKVTEVVFKLGNNNSWNNEIMTNMVNRYNNIYSIVIIDSNDQVDSQVHQMIKQWVMQQIIVQFRLWFWDGGLERDGRGLQLMKEYNQLLRQRQRQCLEYLSYEHRMVGYRNGSSKWKIEQLIVEVDKL